MARAIWQKTVTDNNGAPSEGAQITVTIQGGGAATIFSAQSGGTSRTNPFNTGADGVARFYAERGYYTVTIFKDDSIVIFPWNNLGDKNLFDDLANTAFVESTEYAQTLLADEDAEATRDTLELGTAALGSVDNLPWATVEQTTNYTLPLGRFIFGEEYLWGLHTQIVEGGNVNNNKFIWSGDSTTAGTNAGGQTPSVLGSVIGTRLGLAKATHINSGHSGENSVDWAQTYVGQDIAAHSDMNVYIARWGINDGASGNVSTYIAAMESGLASLRAFKEVADLAIVVMSPNSTFDEPNNRSTAWYEAAIPQLRKICRKYRAVFFDTYALWQDAKQGTTATTPRWLDNPFSDGRGIHPDAVFNLQIVSRVMRMILVPVMDRQNLASNGFNNTHPDSFKPTAATVPGSYLSGLSMWGISSSDGWPVSGKMVVVRNGLKVIQTLYAQEADGTQTVNQSLLMLSRFGDVTTGAFSKYYNQNVEPTLINDFTVFAGRTPKFKHTDSGLCILNGTIGTGASGTTAFILPVEMRPSTPKTFRVVSSSEAVASAILILSDGSVQAYYEGSTFINLDGCIFMAGA